MKHAIIVSIVFLMAGLAFAEDFTNYSLYGMAVESASGDSNQVTVTTTGATYVLTQTGMDMYRRIDPKTNAIDPNNNGKGRKVAQLSFDPNIGPLSIEVNQPAVARIESTKATFQFCSDSFFIVTAKDDFNYTHTNLIANAPWNAPLDPNKRGLDRMWTDGYGGSLHAVMSQTTAPAIGPNSVDYTTFSMSEGNVMAHMVYPPKAFDFNGLYGKDASGQDVRPFVSGISDVSIKYPNLDEYLDGLVSNNYGVIQLDSSFYTNSWNPVLLDSGVMGYEFEPNYVQDIVNFISLAHNKGFKVIVYLQALSWGTIWNYQTASATLEWMKEFQTEYDLDGWYLDNGDVGDLVEDYDFMRQVRTDVGENGVIYHHDSVDVWDNYPNYRGLRAVMIDAYVNYTLTGETGAIAEVNEPNDPYFRFFTSGYGMSQAYGSQIRASNGKAAILFSEIYRVLENLNCESSVLDSTDNWVQYFKSGYDARKAQYINDPNNFVCDVNWPVDATTGWFRYPTDVNVQTIYGKIIITWKTNANSNSAVAYTNNEAWWSPSGPNGTTSNSAEVTNHTITLTGLDPCKPYKFRIRSSNGAQEANEVIWGYVGNFTAPPLLPDAHLWKLDETSGVTAYDSIDTNNGTFNGNDPCWVTGHIGGAADFNGVSDYFSVSSLDSAYSNSSNFTVAGWFKTSQSTDIQTIVGSWSQWLYTPYPGINLQFYSGWQVLVENKKVVARFASQPTIFNITGTSDVNDSNWHHFTLVHVDPYYQGQYTQNTVLYVDGQSEGTLVVPSFGLPNTKFRIGDGSYVISSPVTLKGGPFCGTIDDVMIFNRALTADEVYQLYAIGR